MPNKPIIKFELSRPSLQTYSCIYIGNTVLHRIGSIDEFYEYLGFTQSKKNRGIVFDEFIWEEYTKDGAVQSSDALQAKLIEYLKRHCPNFIDSHPEFNL